MSETDMRLWREAMTHLRHLSDDVFKSMALFLGLNGVLVVALIVVGILEPRGSWWGVAGAVTGIGLTLAGLYMLKRHRVYYLEMLAKKSLLEKELGFYDRKFAGSATDLVFPWRLKPEVVGEIGKDFAGWVRKSVRAKGTMARVYFWMYEALIGGYGVFIIWSLWR